MVEPISSYEIFKGLQAGLVPTKPGPMYYQFQKLIDQLNKDMEDYRQVRDILHKEERVGYLEKTPPGPERKLAYELGERGIRLFNLAHRFLIPQGLLVPRDEWERYRE